MTQARNLITMLVIAGVATLGYARPPARVPSQTLGALSPSLAVVSALQQDEQPKDKQKDDQQKDKPNSKPVNTGKQQEKPDSGKQVKPATDQATDRSQSKEDRDQKQNMAKADRKQDTGHASNGRRIPDQDFKAHFGQEHKFNVRRVVTTTRIVPNQTRFVYTGYTFVFAQPWPAEWAMDDDCYIDYIDGEYYMLDLAHPGVQVALTIVG